MYDIIPLFAQDSSACPSPLPLLTRRNIKKHGGCAHDDVGSVVVVVVVGVGGGGGGGTRFAA